MARRYSVNAGHSAGSPGASGNGLREHVEARWATSRMITRLNAMGNVALNSTSDAATQTAVLTQQRDRARSHNAHVVISNHFNAFSNAQARGVEVLYRNAAMLPLARAVSATIARELGIPNRGPRQRSDLFFLNSFPNNGILIEWAFMTNAADMAAWTALRTRAVDAVAHTIAANTGGRTTVPAATAPAATSAVPNANPFEIVTTAATRFRVTATSLNVRHNPNTNGNPIASLRQDSVFTSTRRANRGEAISGNRRWIATGGGWVSAVHLASPVRQFRTTARSNFRATPNGTIRQTLNINTTVTEVSTTTRNAGGHTWRQVAVGGQRGWIATSLLRAI